MEVCGILLSILLLIIVYIYRLQKKGASIFIDNGVPLVNQIPLFGNMAPCVLGRKCYGDVIKDCYNSAPPDALYMGFMEFATPVILLRDLDLINEITTKNFDHFVNHRPFGDTKGDPLLATFLASMEDNAWHEMRATLTSSFTSRKIKFMFQLVKECTERFAKTIESSCVGSPMRFDTKEVFSKITNDLIVSTAYGVTVDSMKDPKNEFYLQGPRIAEASYTRFILFFLAKSSLGMSICRFFKLRIIPRKVQKYFQEAIESTVRQRKLQGIVRPDMLHLLMEAKSGPEKRDLTLDEIASQAFLFYFGGFDTISTGLNYVAYLLAKHPEIQKKLQTDIDRVYEETGGNVGYDDLQEMKYFDAVILEGLRLFPPISQNDRVCKKRFELPPALPGLKPLVIEPGAVIYLSMLSINQDPKYFPNPEEFIPERFIGENGEIKEPPGYMSFGRGPRMCIAKRFSLMEMKVVLFNLLLKTTLKLCDETIHPTRFSHSIFQHHPEDPIVLTIESRKRGKHL